MQTFSFSLLGPFWRNGAEICNGGDTNRDGFWIAFLELLSREDKKVLLGSC